LLIFLDGNEMFIYFFGCNFVAFFVTFIAYFFATICVANFRQSANKKVLISAIFFDQCYFRIFPENKYIPDVK